MAKKRMIELLDLLLKDLMDSTILFGGKVVVFGEEAKTFVSIDETIEPTNQSQYEDLLHSLNPLGNIRKTDTSLQGTTAKKHTHILYRLTIDKITPQIKEWISKVQVIEKPRPRKSKDGKTRFQIVVVQDENIEREDVLATSSNDSQDVIRMTRDCEVFEDKVVAVLYGEDIEKYADKLTPFSTYLISTAKVRVPLPYGVPTNRFEWVIDRFTVVEEVKDDNLQDPPLPPPTRLNTVPFAYLHDQQRNTEFVSFTVHSFYCSVRPTILTLWEEFADADGSILAAHVAEYPIIVAKRITRTNYAGLSLSTRYNSVILINPPYPQVEGLLNWVRDNRRTLMRYNQQTNSSLVLAPDIVPIVDIPYKSFEVEGKLSPPNDNQDFYELLCSHCGHQYRTHSPKIIHCASCKQRAMLTPRARFEVVMTDSSGSAVATLIGELGEKFLDMTAAGICEIISVKKQPLPLEHVRQRLTHRLFKIQLRKTFSRTSDMRLFIVSYFVKEDLFQLPAAVASKEIGESSNTKLKNVAIGKQLERGESSHSNMQEVIPTEELKNELTTEGSSSTKRKQTELNSSPKKK
ncbi:replication protein A 70 kDa DNA-binding subunit B-like [Nicotiana sylvestris]|uniref:replication protein A 70 kDa DNA-binding subunit B-like n=1 Tax=Nicotiana sylvestris TaxID=4096 RepID=UPI00388CC2B1